MRSSKMRSSRLRRPVASAAALALVALGCGTAAAIEAPAANAAAGCSAVYSVQTDWGSGFTAQLTVTNNGTTAITGWTVTYSYTGNQTLSNGWSGTWTQSGKTVTVANLSYNGSLAVGAQATGIGANFAYSGTNTAPSSVSCTPTGGGGGGGTNTVTVTNPGTQSGTVGKAVSLQISATDSGSGQTLTYSATGLPAGLSISSSGLITGTPTASGSSSVTVTAKDGTGASGSASFTWNVSTSGGGTNTVTVANPGTQTSTVGSAVNLQISATDSGSGQTLTYSATGLPAGLSIASGTGVISGTPTTAATSSVTVTAKDGTGASGSASFSWVVNPTSGGGGGTRVADPFSGAKPYLNPDYVAEVNTQATADNSSAEAAVGTHQTAIWLDTIASIAGGTTATGTRTGLQQQLTNAAAAGTASSPSLVEIVIYDLPGRDCAALASNGEIPATAAGLTEYETQYITPIATILNGFATSNIRVVAIIEPDSLPNVVTNQSVANCQTATTYYEQGITYALNALHAIPNVYNYMDIAHSAWLGWPSNMNATPAVYNSVVKATTAGYASVQGFISDTANYTPTQEPFLTNPTLSIGGNPVDSATFYQYNPTFDELTYDTDMYNTLVSAGFPSSDKFLIDTSRNGWGGSDRPTALTQESTVNAYVTANKIDQRPFRGDWCNQNNAGIGAVPTDQPLGSSSPILAYVWIKPPGESDGDYPTSTHTHGDPHCDPNGTNTDGNGGTYGTGSIPGFDVPAGMWFPAEFQMLVKNSFPAI
jgi:cellulose 1,4-beta-cellobiosidase